MAEWLHSSLENEYLYSSMGQLTLNDATANSRSITGPITRYVLNTRTLIDTKRLKRKILGVKDDSKPHKTVLLVGETGTGKSTLINTIVSYILGVKRSDRIWCELIETKEDQTESQTEAVTVYDVYVKKSEFSLTLIDTPGYGSTEGPEEDLKTTETLYELFRSKDGVHEIDAVCLVMSSKMTRLTDRQLYVFNSILCLFGYDIEKNIVMLITQCNQKPRNAIQAIKKANIKCAKNVKGEPVYFTFDNYHCEIFNKDVDEDEHESIVQEYETALKRLFTSLNNFFTFLDEIKTTSLNMTESVLRNRKQLTASITNLKDRITLIEYKKEELEQTQFILLQNKIETQVNNNFEYEVEEPYKEMVPIESKWWHISKEATCCSVCEENCHYPGCWWARDLSWCSVMTKGKCTVCTGKCDYTVHVKEGKIYVPKTRKVKRTLESLKKKYKIEAGVQTSLKCRLENEIKVQEQEKKKLVDECYQCVVILDNISLKADTVFIMQQLDFLIEKVKEAGQEKRVLKLEQLKRSADDEYQKLKFMFKTDGKESGKCASTSN